MNFITTVLGDIDADQMGYCQPHEHPYIVETPALLTHEELRISNMPASVNELKLLKAAGGDTIVDAQPLATGRDARALAEISRLSGIKIVASTGYHIPIFYQSDHWIYTEDIKKITDLFTEELQSGMYLGGCYFWPEYRTNICAGLVKAMLTKEGVTGRTKELLQAAGIAARDAGVSLMLHTEYGAGAVDAIRLLNRIGLPSERILICHVDRQATDYEIHRQIASTGVFMEYDTITLFEFHNNTQEIDLFRYMIDQGFLNQLLISTDPTVDRLKSYGAKVGMDYLHTVFVPALKQAGFTQETIDTIMKQNPKRALSRTSR